MNPKCLEKLGGIMGKKNIQCATRQITIGRNIILEGKSRDEPFSTYGVQRDMSFFEPYGNGKLHVLRYPVRSDLFEVAIDILHDEYGINKTTTVNNDLNLVNSLVTLPNRNIDAAHFHPVKGDKNNVLRDAVTETMLEMGKTMNLTTFGGQVGAMDTIGRSPPQKDYLRTMLKTKIVVVAQKAEWEGHYRLMEALLSGALVMTDPMHPLPIGYEDKKNVVIYHSLAELERLIIFYLENDKDRLRIARAGCELAITRHRSFHLMERLVFDEEY
jgi:hypothetical protein